MEMGSFFLGQKEKKPDQTKSVEVIPVGSVPSRNGKAQNGKSGFLGSSRDLRAPDLRAAPIPPSVNWRAKGSNSNTRVLMDPAA